MSIKATRACIDAILSGGIDDCEFVVDPTFGFEVPQGLPGVAKQVCNPVDAWTDKAAFEAQSQELAAMFKENFVKYVAPGVTDYTKFGPK
jgi:phosphoenolpyruvate carboxykinase (ATP)